jgi:hypothetical protein
VSALNYWKIIDKESKGFLTLKEFNYLLEALAFYIGDESFNHLAKEHSSANDILPNELVAKLDTKNIFRFRLFEFIFMQRCAIY